MLWLENSGCALLVVVVLLLVWVYCFSSKKEHADIVAPTFGDSLVDKYRASLTNKSGMTLNDYALESHLVQNVPLSGDYRVL
jgi:hypothetical protein